MKIAYIAAGAAGMYCGSCIHDNTLAAALQRQGVEVALVPLYTPLRTDEVSVSMDGIFYGGINVYLQQKLPLFRRTPPVVDRLLDHPALLGGLSRFSASTSARDLGALAVSVLQGEEGRQRKELLRLVRWLKEDYRPDLVQLANSMLTGLAREIRNQLGVPVLCAVQGEDLFLDGLVEPYQDTARALLRERAADVDGFIAPCRYYADLMRGYLSISPERMHVVPLGLNLQGHGEAARDPGGAPFNIGYLARICPEKGFHLLVEAFLELAQLVGLDRIRLHVAGYLGRSDRRYFDAVVKEVGARGVEGSFRYWGEIDRPQKIDFLSQLHVLSVPTIYREPKGLFVLEALANGVPVVQPEHGAFPELLEATGGGILVEPGSAPALARALLELMRQPARGEELGRRGREAVRGKFSDTVMAEETLKVYRQYL